MSAASLTDKHYHEFYSKYRDFDLIKDPMESAYGLWEIFRSLPKITKKLGYPSYDFIANNVRSTNLTYKRIAAAQLRDHDYGNIAQLIDNLIRVDDLVINRILQDIFSEKLCEAYLPQIKALAESAHAESRASAIALYQSMTCDKSDWKSEIPYLSDDEFSVKYSAYDRLANDYENVPKSYFINGMNVNCLEIQQICAQALVNHESYEIDLLMLDLIHNKDFILSKSAREYLKRKPDMYFNDLASHLETASAQTIGNMIDILILSERPEVYDLLTRTYDVAKAHAVRDKIFAKLRSDKSPSATRFFMSLLLAQAHTTYFTTNLISILGKRDLSEHSKTLIELAPTVKHSLNDLEVCQLVAKLKNSEGTECLLGIIKDCEEDKSTIDPQKILILLARELKPKSEYCDIVIQKAVQHRATGLLPEFKKLVEKTRNKAFRDKLSSAIEALSTEQELFPEAAKTSVSESKPQPTTSNTSNNPIYQLITGGNVDEVSAYPASELLDVLHELSEHPKRFDARTIFEILTDKNLDVIPLCIRWIQSGSRCRVDDARQHMNIMESPPLKELYKLCQDLHANTGEILKVLDHHSDMVDPEELKSIYNAAHVAYRKNKLSNDTEQLEKAKRIAKKLLGLRAKVSCKDLISDADWWKDHDIDIYIHPLWIRKSADAVASLEASLVESIKIGRSASALRCASALGNKVDLIHNPFTKLMVLLGAQTFSKDDVKSYVRSCTELNCSDHNYSSIKLATYGHRSVGDKTVVALQHLPIQFLDKLQEDFDDLDHVQRSIYSAVCAVRTHKASEDNLLSMAVYEPTDPKRARNVVRGLGRLKSKKAIETIIRMLNEDDFPLKRACLDALKKIGDPAVIPHLKSQRGNLNKALQTVCVNVIESLEANQLA